MTVLSPEETQRLAVDEALVAALEDEPELLGEALAYLLSKPEAYGTLYRIQASAAALRACIKRLTAHRQVAGGVETPSPEDVRRNQVDKALCGVLAGDGSKLGKVLHLLLFHTEHYEKLHAIKHLPDAVLSYVDAMVAKSEAEQVFPAQPAAAAASAPPVEVDKAGALLTDRRGRRGTGVWRMWAGIIHAALLSVITCSGAILCVASGFFRLEAEWERDQRRAKLVGIGAFFLQWVIFLHRNNRAYDVGGSAALASNCLMDVCMIGASLGGGLLAGLCAAGRVFDRADPWDVAIAAAAGSAVAAALVAASAEVFIRD